LHSSPATSSSSSSSRAAAKQPHRISPSRPPPSLPRVAHATAQLLAVGRPLFAAAASGGCGAAAPRGAPLNPPPPLYHSHLVLPTLLTACTPLYSYAPRPPPGVAPTRMAARDWIYAPALFACCCARTLLFAVFLLYRSVPFFSLGVGFSVELGGEGGLYNHICLLFAARGLTVHLTSVESSASPFLTFRAVCCWLPVVGLWLHLLWLVLVGCGACLPPCCLCLPRQRLPAASSLASVSLSLSVACVLPPVPLSTLVLSTFCPSVCLSLWTVSRVPQNRVCWPPPPPQLHAVACVCACVACRRSECAAIGAAWPVSLEPDRAPEDNRFYPSLPLAVALVAGP